jgi:hypothetical protein
MARGGTAHDLVIAEAQKVGPRTWATPAVTYVRLE